MNERLSTIAIWLLTVAAYLARPWSCMTALQLEVTPPGDPYHSIDPHGFGVLGAMVIALLMMGPVLDAACNHSAFGYSWLVELNAEERQADERGGRAFLDWLAHDIHNGVPILKVNTSPYKARNRSVEYADETNRAVEASRAATPPSRK